MRESREIIKHKQSNQKQTKQQQKKSSKNKLNSKCNIK